MVINETKNEIDELRNKEEKKIIYEKQKKFLK